MIEGQVKPKEPIKIQKKEEPAVEVKKEQSKTESLIQEEKPVAKKQQKQEVDVEKPSVLKEEKALPKEQKPEVKIEKPVKVKKTRVKKEKPEPSEKQASSQVQTVLVKPNLVLDQEKDEFFNVARKFFDQNEIAILSYKIVKKGEIDFNILVPTKLGVQEYFCKAKDKKKVAESDLSSAYLQGQNSKLPIVFLSPGELNKKAKELLSTQFKGMVVKEI
jgi:hypothetical protein